jgi:serine/threonine protein kinase
MAELSEALVANLKEQLRLAVDARHIERVQNVIDALDEVRPHFHSLCMHTSASSSPQALGHTSTRSSLYGQGVQRLRRWCRTSKCLPSCYMLADVVELASRPGHPFSSSALSDVYKGRSRTTEVAVKVIRQHANNHEAVRKVRASSIPTHNHPQHSPQSFRNEAVIWRHLRHPNIVPFLGISDLFPICIVSEWMSGGTISEFLLAHPNLNRSKHVRAPTLEFIPSLTSHVT